MAIFRYMAIVLLAFVYANAYSWECGSNWNNEGNINFEGQVVGIRTLHTEGEPYGREIEFRVISASTSEFSDIQTVTTGLFGVSPGYPFLCGSKYHVYATNNNGRIVTNECYKIEILDNSPGYDALESIVLVGSEGESKREHYLQKLSVCHENN